MLSVCYNKAIETNKKTKKQENKEEINMKTTLDLLNEVVAMGFNRAESLESIDASLDDVFGFENRKEIRDEELSDELYNDILDSFKCELEEC